MDSSRAASMKAHVLATTRSARLASRRRDVALGLQESRQLLGVDVVLRAAERLDPVPHHVSLHVATPSATALGVRWRRGRDLNPRAHFRRPHS